MNVLQNLLNSEKAVVTGLLIIAASALAGLDKMSVAQWMDYTTLLAGFYIGGKTVQGAASAISSARDAKAELAVLKASLAANDDEADAAADALE